jgi:hypothetical protein
MSEFETSIARWVAQTEAGLNLAVRGGVAEMHAYMVGRAPEDTGHLENNFVVTMDAPASFDVPGGGTKEGALSAQRERIARTGFGDMIFITNSVPYTPPFEFGEKLPKFGGSAAGMMQASVFRFTPGAEYALRKGSWE